MSCTNGATVRASPVTRPVTDTVKYTIPKGSCSTM